MKFWNFIKNEESNSVELRINGPILDDDDAWLYEWFGIPCSSPNAFRNELKKYAGKDITVWIDSYGGNVFAAAGMYNALMEHKKSGAKIITKGDSKVMSAATIPYMAGDERFMSPLAIFMMHNPLGSIDGYAQASEFRKIADVLDTVKETIIYAYQLSTGKSREEISAMMDNETYMSAKTAVKEGFATGVLYEDKKEDPENIMNFAFNRLAIQNSVNDSMKRLFVLEKKIKDSGKPNNTNQIKEDKEPMEFNNVEDLKAAYPELIKEIENAAREAGIKAERERIKGIEQISNTINDDLVYKAKFDEPMTAQELAFAALKADAGKGKEYLDKRQKEIVDSNSKNVAPESQLEDGKADEEAAINNIAAVVNSKRGGKVNG